MTILACIIAAAIGFPIGYLLGAAHEAMKQYAQAVTAFILICDIPMFPVEPHK